MKKVNIDKNVPIPPRKKGRWTVVMAKMDIGDSVLLEKRTEYTSMANTAKSMKMKLISRQDGNKFRVWRIK